jgi:ankyrin repeat protein
MTALLLDRGANPDDDESVYHACESRDHTCLRLLLDAGARVDGTNAVAHMLDYDDVEGLRMLLDAGAADLDGVVHHALIRDRSRVHIELLLRHGAPIPDGAATMAVRRGRADLADLLGEAHPTPADELLGAVRRGDRNGVEAVLAAHPGLLGTLGRGDHDVLVHAVATSNRAALDLMLDLGFPIDVRSEEFDETPLHAAAWYGKADMVALLLDRGADVNAEAGRPFHGTPLDWAARGSRHAEQDVLNDPRADHVATVERLLAAGARLGRPEGSVGSATAEVAALLEAAG